MGATAVANDKCKFSVVWENLMDYIYDFETFLRNRKGGIFGQMINRLYVSRV
jgi:hypothetical protein